MHQYRDESPSPSASSHGSPWTPRTDFQVGDVAWHAGSYWRNELPHKSGDLNVGAPTSNLHLWTPLASGGPPMYQQQHWWPQHMAPQAYYGPPPAYPSSSSRYPASHFAPQQSYNRPPSFPAYSSQSQISTSHPEILSPQPLPMPSKPPTPFTDEKQQSSSSGSDDTVLGDPKRGFAGSMDFFANRAGESMRYIALEREAHDATKEDHLRDELDGKRIWKVGGVGVWSYCQDAAQEEKRRKVYSDWREKNGKGNWIKAARARTEFYIRESRGVKPLIMWKLVERGAAIPADALPIGHEADGVPLFAARAWWEGGVHLGKAGRHLTNSASISYGGSEKKLDIFEVLCGTTAPQMLKWMTFRHGESAAVEGWQPVEGGRESDGTAIFLAKGEYENGVHPGKCIVNDDHACVGWGGGELWVRPFQILAYSTANQR